MDDAIPLRVHTPCAPGRGGRGWGFWVYNGGYGQWRSLAARFVRDEEVAGSNPACPTGDNLPRRRRIGDERHHRVPVGQKGVGQMPDFGCRGRRRRVADRLRPRRFDMHFGRPFH